MTHTHKHTRESPVCTHVYCKDDVAKGVNLSLDVERLCHPLLPVAPRLVGVSVAPVSLFLFSSLSLEPSGVVAPMSPAFAALA